MYLKARHRLAMADCKAHWDEVIDYYQKIIALNPQLPQAYLGLGEAFRVLGQVHASC